MPRKYRVLGYLVEKPRHYRVFGYPTDDEEGPRALAVILFFLFVCAAVLAMAWFAPRA